MKPLVLTLRQRLDQRLDLSALVPHRLANMTEAEIARIAISTTRRLITVGDAFRVRTGDVESIRIEDADDRLDQIGEGLTGGEIIVEGDVGNQAGRLMAAGRLTIKGSAGAWAGSGMRGGLIEVAGDAGDRLGGPLAGEIAGMRGGVIVVRGNAGAAVADRVRRGTIIVEGRVGPHPGSRMIAGTLIVARTAGPLPGYLMRRGTIVLGEGSERLSPTFLDCGVHDLLALRLMTAFVREHSRRAAVVLGRPLRRFAGDMAVLGKGEIFVGGEH